MTELEYTLRKICQRRGVSLSKVESVAFNVLVSFGLANDTALMPVVANTFYYVDKLLIQNYNLTGQPAFVITTNSLQGSAGAIALRVTSTQLNSVNYNGFEIDSMLYNISTHSAGSCHLVGTVFKITYA